MPFTHVDIERNPLTTITTTTTTPSKRKSEFSDIRRSPPTLRYLRSPIEDHSPVSRLKPNPYAAEQMTSLPPARRISPSTSNNTPAVTAPPSGRNDEHLPSIRDMVPELPPIGSLAPSATTSQDFGPQSFQPTGPSLRPAATGLAPSPMTSARVQTYPTPDTTPNTIPPFQDRRHPSSAPSVSMVSTTRNSPTQPFTGPIPHRSDSIRSLPPLSTAYGSPESSRSGVYPSQSGPPLPHNTQMQPTAQLPHWQASNQPQNTYHHGGGNPGSGVPSPAYGPPHGMQHPPHPQHMSTSSPSYSHFDNSDYGSDGKSKRRRGNLPKPVTDTLRKWFNEHIAHPYPTEDEKLMLMTATNLSMSQISNWFINARRRSLPQQMNSRDGPSQDPRDGMPMGGYMESR